MKKFSEFVFDLLGEVIQLLRNLLLWSSRQDELHVGQIFDDGGREGLLNQSHGDLLLALLGLNEHLLALLVVGDDTLHHTNSLWKGTVVVMCREGILLQELILDQLGNLKETKLKITICNLPQEWPFGLHQGNLYQPAQKLDNH